MPFATRFLRMANFRPSLWRPSTFPTGSCFVPTGEQDVPHWQGGCSEVEVHLRSMPVAAPWLPHSHAASIAFWETCLRDLKDWPLPCGRAKPTGQSLRRSGTQS